MKHTALPSLSTEHAAWLAATMERNRSRFGGFFMGPEGDSDDADEDDDSDDAGSDSDDSDKDDAGTDWKAKFEAQQRINKSLERKTRKDAATIASLTGKKPEGGGKDGKAGDDGSEKPDVDKIKAEAKAEAAREALNGRIEDKIEAKARAFADPEDAVAVLLRSHNYDDFLDEKDQIDVEAITEALKELGEKKPHLLAQGGRFQGGADGGARKETKERAKSLGEAISRHYDKS